MKVILDTDVVLDYIVQRENFSDASTRIFTLCENGFMDGFITAQSISDIFYIIRKDYSVPVRKEMLNGLFSIVDFVEITKWHVTNALSDKNLRDLENGFIMKCAEDNMFDYIISRDRDGFATSRIPVVTPLEFLSMVRT